MNETLTMMKKMIEDMAGNTVKAVNYRRFNHEVIGYLVIFTDGRRVKVDLSGLPL